MASSIGPALWAMRNRRRSCSVKGIGGAGKLSERTLLRAAKSLSWAPSSLGAFVFLVDRTPVTGEAGVRCLRPSLGPPKAGVSRRSSSF